MVVRRKKRAKTAKKPKAAARLLQFASYTAGFSATIARDEIYYRLEYFFHASARPGQHVIPPGAPIAALLKNLTLADLYVNLNRASPVNVPAWQSQMFHGVMFPWTSVPNVVIDIQDLKSFGDLIDCAAGAYRMAGWQVT